MDKGLYLIILDSRIQRTLVRTQRVTPPQPRSKLQDVTKTLAVKMSVSTCTCASTADLDGDTPSIKVDSPPSVSKQSAAVFSGFCCLLKWMMVKVKIAKVAETRVIVKILEIWLEPGMRLLELDSGQGENCESCCRVNIYRNARTLRSRVQKFPAWPTF